MFCRYVKRRKSNRGRIDKNDCKIPDRLTYHACVVARRVGDTIHIGYAVVDPRDMTTRFPSRKRTRLLALQRLASERFTIGVSPSVAELDDFMSGRTRPVDSIGLNRPIPKIVRGLITEAIENLSLSLKNSSEQDEKILSEIIPAPEKTEVVAA